MSSERRPLQILRIRLPKCRNVHGSAPCTATQTGDAKCYNTFSTCNDPLNYREIPDDHLAADLTRRKGEAVASGDLTRTADLFAAFDVAFPLSPTGTIWEQGGSADQAAYLGITGSNLVFRAGDGTVSDGVNVAKIEVAHSTLAGRTVTLFCEIDVSASTVTLWEFDPVTLKLTELGSDTASSGLPASWAGADGGAVGADGGSNIATGEDGGAFSGLITQARFFDSQAAPDMTDGYRTELYLMSTQAERPADDIRILPLLDRLTTGGSRINLAGQDGNYEPLGGRATLQATFRDAPVSDRWDDDYLADRTFEPLDFGTMWTKFRLRHKFGKVGAQVTLFEGYHGERLADMNAREYILESMDFSGRDSVSIRCRDVLTKSEWQKAQAPAASPGVLLADIAALDTTVTVTGATANDYDTSGTIRINREVMTYSGFTEESDGSLAFTITQRGSDNTEAAAHAANDSVQLCLRYTAATITDILTDLEGRYAGISYQNMNLSGWASEYASYLSAYRFSRLITEPRPVKELIGQLTVEGSFYHWWNERTQLLEVNAIRGLVTAPDVLNDDANLVADSITVREKPEQRITEIWYYYNPRDPTEKEDEEANYQNLLVQRVTTRYGQERILKVFGRWTDTEAQALQTASRMARRFRDIPVEVEFRMSSKDRSVWVGDNKYIHHRRIVDRNGRPDTKRHFLIISAEDLHMDDQVQYTAIDATLAGFIYVILDNSVGDYVGDGTDQFNGAWISNSLGLYSNGDPGARIS